MFAWRALHPWLGGVGRGRAERGPRERALPHGAALGLALAAVAGYWLLPLVVTACRVVHEPWPVEVLGLFLYFAHFSAIGGLLAGLASIRAKKPGRVAFWGAVLGAIIGAALMC
jgi:membrane associated rhomboid family serine protease